MSSLDNQDDQDEVFLKDEVKEVKEAKVVPSRLLLQPESPGGEKPLSLRRCKSTNSSGGRGDHMVTRSRSIGRHQVSVKVKRRQTGTSLLIAGCVLFDM